MIFDTPDGDEAVELLVDMIKNACVNTGEPTSGHEIRSVRTIQEYLGEIGTVVEPIPGRASVIYRVRGTDPNGQTLLLIPHLDVVPANAADWSHDPFTGTDVAGFIWGRGAVDMLNVTAAMVVVFRWIRDGVIPPPTGDVILACVADEEAGCTFGIEWLVAKHRSLIECRWGINEVGGFPIWINGKKKAYLVQTAEKGICWCRITIPGTPGHGSVPIEDNEIGRAHV